MIFIRYFRAGLGSGYQQWGEPASPLCTTSWRGRTHWYSFGKHSTLPILQKKYWVHFAFEYDALGRRTAKINLSSKRIKRFLWDGNVPLHEWEYDLSERPNLSRDKDNLLVYDKEEPVTDNLITWVFDENSFVPAAKLVGDKSYSILTDHLGTPYEAYDENGEKVLPCKTKLSVRWSKI